MKTGNLLNRLQIRGISGGELRKLRDEVCYSQEYMAKQLGIAQSTYQRIESGEIKISFERLIKISDIFDNLNNAGTELADREIIKIKLLQSELVSLKQIINQQKEYIKELEKLVKKKK